MTVRNLSNISFDIILECFLKAFDNYFIELPRDKVYYKQRWKAAKVDFNYSYGMFEGNKMIGFIIHAIDKRRGKITAFNTGTGVIPEYRGKRIIKSIYAHILKDLAETSIEQSTLEVITKNDIAIKLYKGIGFEKSREYKCFNGHIEIEMTFEPVLREVNLKNVDWDNLPNQELYSWDYQKESIMEGNYRFFYVIHNKQPESFFIINPKVNCLAQFDLLNKQNKGWERLFAGIKKISESIKINNVDNRLKEKQDILVSVGLKNTIDQFEMELKIKNGNNVDNSLKRAMHQAKLG